MVPVPLRRGNQFFCVQNQNADSDQHQGESGTERQEQCQTQACATERDRAQQQNQGRFQGTSPPLAPSAARPAQEISSGM